MLLSHILLLCIFGQRFGYVSTKEQFLRFTSTLPIHQQHLYYESPGPISPIEIDATVTQQVRVRILDFLNDFPELKLHCHIVPLDADSELSSAQLCQKKSLSSPEQCVDPKGQTPQFDAIRFTAIGNRSHGYTFHSILPVGTALLDAFYFCRFRNKRGELTSNMVELQDVFYYQKKMVSRDVEQSPKFLPTLTVAELPLQLECGRPGRLEQHLPSWADQGFPSPFRWSFCEFTNSGKDITYNCLTKVREAPIRVSDYFEHVILPNGTLILYKRTPAVWKNMGLLCWSHVRSTAIFSVYFGGSASNPEPILYNPDVDYPSERAVQPLSPRNQVITFRKGPNNGAVLLATYRADMKTIRAEWTKDNDHLPFGFPEPTEFALVFPEFVHDNHSGIYELRVRSQRSVVRFKYTVAVVGPPEVIKSPPAVLLVMEGNDAIFSCEMTQFQSTSLKINGEEFFPNSAQTTNRLMEQFPYLSSAVIHPLDINGSHLAYRATNLVFTPGSFFGPTHTVTIIGANNFGYAVVSTFVRVLPRPRILDSPANYPCGPPCLSSTSHTFDCKLDLAPYSIAHVKQTWDWNGTDVSTMRRQNDDRTIYLEEKGTQLRLLPVLDIQRATLFANSRAVCRLRIYYPAVLAAASSGSGELAFINPKWIVYDSRSDAAVQSALTAEVKLIPDVTSNPASASISWIAAVIIAILIILVVGALTACLVMRNRGETYLLDKEERALGNDPEKELRENEAFRTYERAEEPPLHGSRCSLNDDSAEIGSDADGELDDYNLDPGKFNEEGSFIDQYATETHYKGALRLPVLSRPYDPLV